MRGRKVSWVREKDSLSLILRGPCEARRRESRADSEERRCLGRGILWLRPLGEGRGHSLWRAQRGKRGTYPAPGEKEEKKWQTRQWRINLKRKTFFPKPVRGQGRALSLGAKEETCNEKVNECPDTCRRGEKKPTNSKGCKAREGGEKVNVIPREKKKEKI